MQNKLVMQNKQVNDSRRRGRELANALNGGAAPQTVPTRMALRPGEACFGEIDVQVWQWLEGDGEYVRKSGGYYGGGVAGLIALRGASAIGNSRRRAAAAREAAAQWRVVDRGRVFLISQRFSIQGETGWRDIWFSGVRMSDCDGVSIALEIDGWPSTRLEMPYPDYWFVLFRKLAYNHVMMPPWPDDEPFTPAAPPPQDQAPAGESGRPSAGQPPEPDVDLRSSDDWPSGP